MSHWMPLPFERIGGLTGVVDCRWLRNAQAARAMCMYRYYTAVRKCSIPYCIVCGALYQVLHHLSSVIDYGNK